MEIGPRTRPAEKQNPQDPHSPVVKTGGCGGQSAVWEVGGAGGRPSLRRLEAGIFCLQVALGSPQSWETPLSCAGVPRSLRL